jgi:Na+:H+ antiporter, NhaA family
MAIFFLLVGLEIKRELIDGQLSNWPRRILPGIAAAGGMAAPAAIYVALNAGSADTLRGWAIPAATDIARPTLLSLSACSHSWARACRSR